jgi:hypothetical protein
MRRFFRSGGTLRRRSPTCAASRLARERAVGCRAMAFVPQRVQRGTRTFRRGPFLCFILAFRIVAHGSASGLGGSSAFRWRRQLHSSPTGFRQSNRNGLFGGPRSVHSFPDMLHFLPYELPGLRAGGLAFPFVLAGSCDGFLFWHMFWSSVDSQRNLSSLQTYD